MDSGHSLRSLRDDDANLLHLRLCICTGYIVENYGEDGDCFPGSSDELVWLGYFAKKSTHLQKLTLIAQV